MASDGSAGLVGGVLGPQEMSDVAQQRARGLRRDKAAAARADAVARSCETLGELVAKLEAAASTSAEEAALLDAVQAGAAAPSVAALLSQPDEMYRRLAINAGSALCRDLLVAFARSDDAQVIQAEQRLALAHVLRAWLPLPGGLRPAARPGTSLMQALRSQMMAEWSALRNTRKVQARVILSGREPRLHRWYSSTGASGVPELYDFYRRRAYDAPRASTAEGISALWDLVGGQPAVVSSVGTAMTAQQQGTVLRAGMSEPRWRTRWDGRAALFEAGVVERLVRLLPMAADMQQSDLQLVAPPAQDPEGSGTSRAEERDDALNDLPGIKLEGKSGRWRAVRDGETFPPGHRYAPSSFSLCVCRFVRKCAFCAWVSHIGLLGLGSFSMNLGTGERFVRIDTTAAASITSKPGPATNTSAAPPDWRARLPATEGVVRLQLLPGRRAGSTGSTVPEEEDEDEDEEDWEPPAVSLEEHIDVLRSLRSLCRATPQYLGAWSDAGGARSLLLLVKPASSGCPAAPVAPQLQMELILGLRGLLAFLAYELRQQPANQQRAAVCISPSLSQESSVQVEIRDCAA